MSGMRRTHGSVCGIEISSCLVSRFGGPNSPCVNSYAAKDRLLLFRNFTKYFKCPTMEMSWLGWIRVVVLFNRFGLTTISAILSAQSCQLLNAENITYLTTVHFCPYTPTRSFLSMFLYRRAACQTSTKNRGRYVDNPSYILSYLIIWILYTTALNRRRILFSAV